MEFEPLSAITPVDGRYRKISEALAPYFSESGLIHKRLIVESEYLIALSETPGVGLRKFTDEEKTILLQLPNISVEEAGIVKKIEREGYEGIPATNHDYLFTAKEKTIAGRARRNTLPHKLLLGRKP